MHDTVPTSLTLEEAVDNMRDPQWGDPVQSLALHASHWLEVAALRHPECQADIDILSAQLDEACGDAVDATHLLSISTEGEMVIALEKIVAVMRAAAAWVRDAQESH